MIRLFSRIASAWRNDAILWLHLVSLFDKPDSLQDLPHGHRNIRNKICELLKELNNGATSPGEIALQIAREKLDYHGWSMTKAKELLQHDDDL